MGKEKKRYGCTSTYLVYVVLFIVYFIVVSKLITILFPELESGDVLVAVNVIAALLSTLTAVLIWQRKRIVALFRREKRQSD